MATVLNPKAYDLAAKARAWIDSTWQYRWYAVAAAWVLGAAGWGAVALISDRYQASSRVYVDTQSILRPLLAGLAIQPNITQIVEMMSRTLINRPNVERLIEVAGVEPPNSTPQMHEETINRLTHDLSIKGAGSQNLYTISYAEKDPEKAKRVVQALLTIFEGSLGDKRKDSDSARTFIEDQLKVYAERLTAAENAVTEFKRKNLGLMPGQGENFYTKLVEMRTALNQARLELAEAEQGRDAIKRRFAEEAPPSLIDERVMYDSPPADSFTSDFDARIQALQQKLDTLRLSFTERHPDIVAIVPVLEQLKEQRQREREQKQREASARKPAPAPSAKTQDLVTQQLTISMAEYDANIASLKARVSEYSKRLGELGSAANALPQVEAQYTQLTRDYDVTKKNYDQLAARRESAQLSGDVQSNASTMEFRVVDPPVVSARPDWPNRPLLRTLVLLGALGAGMAFAFLISLLWPTVNGESRLREISGLTVLGTVAMTFTDGQKRRKKNGIVALSLCVLALVGVYAALMAAPAAQRMPQQIDAPWTR